MFIKFKTVLPEIIVHKIIKKTTSEFENKYLFKTYNNEAVSTGLKIKPKDLMKKIFSDVFYFIKLCKNKNEYDDYYYDEEYESLNENNEKGIVSVMTDDEVEEKILKVSKRLNINFNDFEKEKFKIVLLNIENINNEDPKIFNYINYCFTSLYACNYEKYIKIIKKKIFLHYGEDTIHHYSYLKKAFIQPQTVNLRHFDNPHLKNIFENNSNFYWLYISMINHIDQIKKENENYELLHLKKALKEYGLSEKGWGFLKKQTQHYITRMCQSIHWSIFCANYGLKDAWLRNVRHKSLFNKSIQSLSDVDNFTLKKLYCSLGKSCSSWNKPVTKFCMISSQRLKLAVKYISENNQVISLVEQSIKDNNIDYSCSIYARGLRNSEYYFYSYFYPKVFDNILTYLINKKDTSIGYFRYNSMNDIYNGYYHSDLGKPNDDFNFDICHENLKELDYVAYDYLKKCPNLITISQGDFLFNYLKLKDETVIHKENIYPILLYKIFNDLRQSIINDHSKLTKKIEDKFGEKSLSFLDKICMRRNVSQKEFDIINNDQRVISSNPLLFNDFIRIIPFSGDNYLKDIKSYLNNYGLTQSGWTHILSEYNKCKNFSFFDSLKFDKYDSIDLGIIFAIKLFNYNIPFKYFKFISKYIDRFIAVCNNNNNLNVFCSALLKSFTALTKEYSQKGKIKNAYIFSNIISSSRKNYYIEYISHNKIVTFKDMFERDMQMIYDYIIRGCEEEVLPQSGLKKLIEKANKWHEENLIANLKDYEYLEEDINHLSIDNEFTFKQIKNTEEISKEAHDMKHCIASYNDDCYEDIYVAYHMTSRNGESATLGIIKYQDSYSFEQIYSFRNRPVSKEARQASKHLVELLNQNKAENSTNISDKIKCFR